MKKFEALKELPQEIQARPNPANPEVLYVPLHDEYDEQFYMESKILRNDHYNQVDFNKELEF